VPVVAFCTDIAEFHQGRILEAEYAARFPGAAVIPAFAQALRNQGWDVVTGDQVLDPAWDSTMSVHDVFIVQEENSSIGRELIERGAIPTLILSGESPLYARDFYRDVSVPCKGFPHRVLFTGAHAPAGSDGTNHPLLFPAFHTDQAPLATPWAERGFMAILAGNKYWRHSDIPWPARLERFLQERRDREYTSWLQANQLHDERLELIAHFANQGKIDVYGAGWDNRRHLPARYRERLQALQPAGGTINYETKHQLLSNYRFTLTLENFVYPGYVTEKIFDALASGSIPVYQGAPDIEAFIPREAFIDLRGFSSLASLEDFLDNLSEADRERILEAGQNFLASNQGQQHSYENRGNFLAGLVGQVAATR